MPKRAPTRRSRARLALRVSDARLLAHLERLDHVADRDVVVVAERDTALEALADLGRVVLEPAQAGDRQVVRHDRPVADEPRLGVAPDESRPDDATRDVAETRRAEDLADLRRAELDLFVDRLEHALEGRLDLLDGLVDDRVVADLHALAVGQVPGATLGPHVEADDDRIGRAGQVDVVLRDGADA